MKYSELRDDGAMDLGKEVERLRIQVMLEQQGCLLPAGEAEEQPLS